MLSKPVIFVTRAIPQVGLDALAHLGDLRVASQDAPIDRAALEAGIADATALVSMLTDPIDAALLERAPHLKVVANFAAGTNNIDLEACRQRGIIVTNTPDVLAQATAELALGLILDLCRGLTVGDQVLRAGGFPGWGPLYRLGRGLQGQTLGLVGFGSIGQELAKMVQVLGVRVLYYQRHRLSPEREAALAACYCPLDELLSQSDIVSLHCPLTPETRHLLNAERLSRMKPGSILINTARGPVVDEAALVLALRQGPLAGAGLDVYEHEPQVHPGLLELSNVLLLPHLGSATVQAREAMADLVVQNVAAVLAGKVPPTTVK
jgi:glyoxylate reductase